MNPAASIHVEMTVKKVKKHALIALFLSVLIPLIAIWAIVEGNKLRELGRESLGTTIMVAAGVIFLVRGALYWAGGV